MALWLPRRQLPPVHFEHCLRFGCADPRANRTKTGMPIKAAADKLIREMEMFGPDFEGYGKPNEADVSGRGMCMCVLSRSCG